MRATPTLHVRQPSWRAEWPFAGLLLTAIMLLAGVTELCAQADRLAGSSRRVPAGLPPNVTYDLRIPTPASVLGWEVGTWHVRPDQIVRYFERLAQVSDRFHLETYGATHEQRPLLLATVSTPANLGRIEQIREEHVAAVRAGDAPSEDRKAVVWMGYSVHGNEPSGANASLLMAYYLAAAQGPGIEQLLENTVILMDPAINPDGLGRFAHWANMYKGRQLVGDAWHKEHREAWPGGRTNHYWFDLNRDWLLLTHPESRGRIAKFQAWKPNLLTDHHEMGTSSTFFFQPGVPSRQNPRTPAANLELTRAIAAYHAEALDASGEIYYSEEGFDDFYYGKGSTYPDVQGAVGILFEQASSRGHLQTNAWGELSFPETIANQVTASLSTLRAAGALRQELLQLQADATNSAREEAAEDPIGAYVFGHARDAARVAKMADILRRHDIAVHGLQDELELDGVSYRPGMAYLVPCDQLQYRLMKSLFEARTEFEDDTFYDVSTWVFPMAFGLDHGELRREDFGVGLGGVIGERLLSEPIIRGVLDLREDYWAQKETSQHPVAYAFEWHGLHAPRALARLHAAGVVPQVATRPMTVRTRGGPVELDYGSILVPTGVQDMERVALREVMQRIAAEDGLRVHSLRTGWTSEGLDLGSPSARPLQAPRPVLLTGGGVSSYAAGEVWHQLDMRWEQPLAMADVEDFGSIDLETVTHVLMVGGGGGLSESQLESLKGWVRGGGVLVASGSAASWATTRVLGQERADSDENEEHEDEDEEELLDERGEPVEPAYADYEADRAKTLVSGSIFETRVDLTHPLAYGMVRDRLPVFRTGTSILERSSDPYADVCVYTRSPLLSGYSNAENVERIAGTTAATAQRFGGGSVVRIADDPLFRGYWYGSARLYANALYFGDILKYTRSVVGAGASEADEGLSSIDEH